MNKIIFYFVIALQVICFCRSAIARVDQDVCELYEESLEDHLFLLREDLISYSGKARFEIDRTGFIHKNTDNEGKSFFSRGELVRIDEIDFKVRDVEVDIEGVDSGVEGKIIFVFKDRLSDEFAEKSQFDMRFREIFMDEKVKTFGKTVDKISENIENGKIYVGQTKNDLFLTLGKPHDIVNLVNETSFEEITYFAGDSEYTFYFADEILYEWRKKRI